MRDEEAWVPVRFRAYDEARRERGDAGEEIAVGQAERDRVRRAVGKAAQRHPGGVDRQTREHVLERPIQEADIVAEAVANRVPGRAAGVRREHRQPI